MSKKKVELGAQKQSGDRDLRKQHIMAYRTAWLENQLKEFTFLLSKNLDQPVDIETILSLFFHRSAIEVVTDNMILYKYNTQGLTPKFRNILEKLIEGFNLIGLTLGGRKVFAELVSFS